MHPKVAYRSCDHCRDFQYNEQDGEVTIGRDGEPMKRLGKTPCEARIGCAKGHWADLKFRRLTLAEESLVALFHASKATGGAMLSEDERRDDVLALLFSYLERIHQARNINDMASSMAATMVQIRGR
jgi:hypothetical protein